MTGEVYAALQRALAEERLVALATVVAESEEAASSGIDRSGVGRQLLIHPDGSLLGDLGGEARARAAAEAASELFATFGSRRLTAAGADLFVEVLAPRPQLILVGAVHTAIPLIRYAAELGMRTVVVDPRGAFATEERVGHADEVIAEWPAEAFGRLRLDEATALAVLSHDPKIDQPALELALASPVGYIGALGSKKTHARRVAALEEKGFDEVQIARIHAPIGIDLGGRRPPEIALAVIAEIVAARHGKRLVAG